MMSPRPRPDEWYDAFADYCEALGNDARATQIARALMDELDTLRAVFDNAAMLHAAYPDDEEYALVAQTAEKALRDAEALGAEYDAWQARVDEMAEAG